MTAPIDGDRITDADRELLATTWNAGAMLRFMNARLGFPDAETVRCDLIEAHAGHRGGIGSAAINGGVIGWFFDITLGCTPLLVPPLRRSATIEVTMRLERALRGDRLRCEAKVDRATSSIVFASGVVTDERGDICARGNALVKLGPRITIEDWARALGPEASFATAKNTEIVSP